MTEEQSSPASSLRKPWRLGFWSLIATQFQGAFSDNMLKWVVIFLVIGLGMSQARRDLLVVLVVPLLFAAPFLLFSMAGGYLADRFSKRRVTTGTKCMEIAVMFLALAGLATHNLALAVAAIFLIGTQAALFGPSKYGLLPELLPEEKLSWGNGILELGTFLAILTGTIAGGVFSDLFQGRDFWSGVILVGLAVIGLATSLGISRVPEANPLRRLRLNPAAELWGEIREIRKDSMLWMAVLGNIFFWFLGSLVLINIVLYATDILHTSDTETSLLMAAVTLGIGVGSLVSGYLSGNKIEYGLIPLGVLGITVFAALLARPHLSFGAVATRLGFVGFFAGFFAVPINALIQYRPRPERKGSVIAAANLLSFLGIAFQPVAQYAMLRLGHPNPAEMFLIIAGMTFIATAVLMTALPGALMHFLVGLTTHPLAQLGGTQRGEVRAMKPAVPAENLPKRME